MASFPLPSYTVYNNPAFAEFISDYFHKDLYRLKIMKEGELLTELPLIRMRKSLTALPFASAMGLNALPAHLSPSQWWPFMNACMEEFKNEQTTEIQFPEMLKSIHRKDHGKPALQWQLRSFYPASPYINSSKCISFLPLKRNEDEIFAGFSSNLRRKIRKAAKNEIIIKAGGTELAGEFYSNYKAGCTYLGSPVLEKEFYRGMAAAYGAQNAKFFIASLQEKAVGAALLLFYRRQCEIIYFAGLPQYKHLYPSYLLVWEMIRHAAARNTEVFSFGRSDTGSGVHRYKKQWGSYELPIYWSHSSPPLINIRRFKGLTGFWPLLPEFIREKAGPGIARRIY